MIKKSKKGNKIKGEEMEKEKKRKEK